MVKKQFVGLDNALKNGMVVRAFRSGGGLRVVRVEDPKISDGEKALKGYGEMPNLRPALMLASRDYQAGGLPYECHYLTGSSEAEESLDLWVLQGHKLHAKSTLQGNVRLEARSWDGKDIAFVESEDFGSAYSGLVEKVDETAFEKARL